MKYLMPAIRFKIFMTLLLGIIYPFAVTGITQVVFPRQASGDFISRGGQVIGSTKIGQTFEKPQYFWSRPSAISYNPLPSGGSNLGQDSQALKEAVEARIKNLKAAHPDQSGEPPQILIFASGSGLDPHITPDAAEYQVQRVAKNRNLGIDVIRKFVQEATTERQLGIFGEPTVNVLTLNLLLDKAQGIESAPILVPVPEAVPPTPAPVQDITESKK